MDKHTHISSSKKTIIKMVSVLIIAFYALYPFGNQIIRFIHHSTHLATSLVKSSQSDHHHLSHFSANENNFLQSADEISHGHSHPVIAFFSAALDSEESKSDSQKTVNFTLDHHLIPPPEKAIESEWSGISRKDLHFSEALISPYFKKFTPPPRLGSHPV